MRRLGRVSAFGGLVVGLSVLAPVGAGAQYPSPYAPPSYAPPSYAPPYDYAPPYGYAPPPPPPGYVPDDYYAPPPRRPIGFRCGARAFTPDGPRRIVCDLPRPRPLGRPCDCPPPSPPPGYSPGPPLEGRVIP